MTKENIKALVVSKLHQIAPEMDMNALEPTENIREELDIDSIDWLNFLVAIEEQVGIAIPESDYDQLDTMEHLLAYLNRGKV